MATGYVCAECGLAYDPISPKDAEVAIRSYPRRFREALGHIPGDSRREALLRRKPDEKTWSSAEYTAHVADLLDAMATVVRRMTTEDSPDLGQEFFDPDERAVSANYNERDIEEVLTQLQGSAQTMADAAAGVAPADWNRTAQFPWGERDALTMLRNAVHEGHHHLRDIERVLEQVRSG